MQVTYYGDWETLLSTDWTGEYTLDILTLYNTMIVNNRLIISSFTTKRKINYYLYRTSSIFSYYKYVYQNKNINRYNTMSVT